MKRIGILLLSMIACLSVLIIYNSITNEIEFSEYEGRSLKIGVFGDFPTISEEQIEFVKVDFDSEDIETQIKYFDAIFITEDNLAKASKDQYLGLYRNNEKPFFFIKSKKSFMPFTIDGLEYDEVDWDSDKYITGILYKNENLKYWGYCLYNDVENEKNVKEVYSRVFKTIDDCRNELKRY